MGDRRVTSSNPRLDEIVMTFEANYPAYQYRVVEFVVDHISDLSRVFEGDLQEMLVLAIVGQVQLLAMRTAAQAGVDPWSLTDERLSINASRIADVTAIPRETVRRKLRSLEQRGWVIQTANSAWRLAVDGGVAKAKLDLNDVDRRSISRVARLFAGLEQIACNGKFSPSSPRVVIK
jgi:predicted transcriptional regulator